MADYEMPKKFICWISMIQATFCLLSMETIFMQPNVVIIYWKFLHSYDIFELVWHKISAFFEYSQEAMKGFTFWIHYLLFKRAPHKNFYADKKNCFFLFEKLNIQTQFNIFHFDHKNILPGEELELPVFSFSNNGRVEAN
jgi:hypothetical protein